MVQNETSKQFFIFICTHRGFIQARNFAVFLCSDEMKPCVDVLEHNIQCSQQREYFITSNRHNLCSKYVIEMNHNIL